VRYRSQAWDKEARKTVEEAVQFAKESAPPKRAALHEHVYVEQEAFIAR